MASKMTGNQGARRKDTPKNSPQEDGGFSSSADSNTAVVQKSICPNNRFNAVQHVTVNDNDTPAEVVQRGSVHEGFVSQTVFVYNNSGPANNISVIQEVYCEGLPVQHPWGPWSPFHDWSPRVTSFYQTPANHQGPPPTVQQHPPPVYGQRFVNPWYQHY